MTLTDRARSFTAAHGPAFANYLVVGGVAAAIHFSAACTVLRMGVGSAILANAIGFVFGFCASYSGNYAITFRSSAKHHVATPKFLAVGLASLAATSGLVWAFETLVGFPPALAIAGAIAIVPFVNFFLAKLWVF